MNEDPQELARRFNEDEAVWRSFEERRRARGLPNLSSLDQLLDALDWLKAEREQRQIRAIAQPAD